MSLRLGLGFLSLNRLVQVFALASAHRRGTCGRQSGLQPTCPWLHEEAQFLGQGEEQLLLLGGGLHQLVLLGRQRLRRWNQCPQLARVDPLLLLQVLACPRAFADFLWGRDNTSAGGFEICGARDPNPTPLEYDGENPFCERAAIMGVLHTPRPLDHRHLLLLPMLLHRQLAPWGARTHARQTPRRSG